MDAGQAIGIPNFGRHAFRTLLDNLGTPIGVQQKLMRHSDFRTPMNLYGSAYEKIKRRTNMLVAGKLLPEAMQTASIATIQ
jgi:integrase